MVLSSQSKDELDQKSQELDENAQALAGVVRCGGMQRDAIQSVLVQFGGIFAKPILEET